MKQFNTVLFCLLALVCVWAGCSRPALAQVTETVLHKFTSGTDGEAPYAGVILGAGGEVYGTTGSGGPGSNPDAGCYGGTVFELIPPRGGQTVWNENLLWGFSGADGCLPFSPVFAYNPGNSGKKPLWGVTTTKGRYNNGTVFELADIKLSTLWNFTGGNDGSGPFGGLIADKRGALYGVTGFGGASGDGTVFKIDPVAGTLTTIWSFSGSDGAQPEGNLLIDDSGAIYGTTAVGGLNNSNGACSTGYPLPAGCGTVFKLAPPDGGQSTWTLTTLYFFTGGADGSFPVSAYAGGGVVSDKNGALYGTTYSGGTFGSVCDSFGCGVVFKLTPPASGQGPWTETVLWSFSGYADGDAGNGSLIIDKNGVLYGTTQFGGSFTSDYCSLFGCGIVFKLSPPTPGQTAWTETTLWSFTGLSDGQTPVSGVVANQKGALYGTTLFGGTFTADPPCQQGCGVVFKLDATGFAPGNAEEAAAK